MVPQTILIPHSLSQVLYLLLHNVLALGMEKMVNSQLQVLRLFLLLALVSHVLMGLLKEGNILVAIMKMVFLQKKFVVLFYVKVADGL